MIVLDASVAVSWLLAEHTKTAILDDLLATRRILVPSHWTTEVSHAILKALRRKSIPQAKLIDIAKDIEVLDVVIQPPTTLSAMIPMIGFAQENGLTVYDAAYVQLALARNAELATFDNAMRQAAGRLGVTLIPSQ